jgi:flagellar hook-basal body complex protein FliE
MTVGKIIDPNAALQAYANSAAIQKGGDNSSGGAGGFASFLEKGLTGALGDIKTAETMSAQAITGKADLTEVVQAVNSAELALRTVTGVRDRMIAAYQDIMRMQV